MSEISRFDSISSARLFILNPAALFSLNITVLTYIDE